MRTILVLALAALISASCKYRYFMLEGNDFAAIEKSVKNTGLLTTPAFLENKTCEPQIFEFCYCRTKENSEGVHYYDFRPCDPDEIGSDTVRRIALLLLDDQRAVYFSSEFDWNKIPDPVFDLCSNNIRVMESRKSDGHRPFVYYRGYYKKSGVSLSVVLEQGIEKTRRAIRRTDDIRSRANDDLNSSEWLHKRRKKAEASLLWMNFQANRADSSLILNDIEYFDNDYGINLDAPIQKTMAKNFEQQLVFQKGRWPQKLRLVWSGCAVRSISSQDGKLRYHAADSTFVEDRSSRKNILTW